MAGKARLRCGWWLGCVLVTAGFGCGDDDDDAGASVPALCKQLVAATCDRIYTCASAAAIEAEGLPDDEADCRTQVETRSGCAKATAESACADEGGTYHADQARKCIDQTEEQTCEEFANETGTPACDQICSGGSAPTGDASVPALCKQRVAATCERIYACAEPADIEANDLPATEAGCRSQLEELRGCDGATGATICVDKGSFHAAEARTCIDQTEAQTCEDFVNETGTPACDEVCS